MKTKIFIAGSGGIGKAVGLILKNQSHFPADIIYGDINEDAAISAVQFVKEGSGKSEGIDHIIMPESGSDTTQDNILRDTDIILDCLPGSQAPRMAALARKFQCHYTNLTEYVQETHEVEKIAKGAETAFVLQTGLAPGFINVLACQQYNEFVRDYKSEILDSMHMKVGALSKHAISPHFYAFTWSPIGVATEYLKNAIIVRNFKTIEVPALSGRQAIILDGDKYEDNFTSGGAADLPEAFSGKIKDLDYKTLRYPGHYTWVESALSTIPDTENRVKALERIMLQNIPSVEDDEVVIYASVQGKDHTGRLRRKEASYRIYPSLVGNKKLRAIQTTTAAPMCEIARMMMEKKWKGTIKQSMIDPADFLNGPFVSSIYGKYGA